MQLNLTVDCTPAEARAFLGLPDLTPLHDIYIDKMRQMAVDGVSSDDMEKMFRLWTSGLNEGFNEWQRLFWQAASTGLGGAPAKR